MFERFRHWLTPHHTNNYRARILQNAGLVILIAGFLTFTAVTRLLEMSPLHILGFTSTITVDEVITQTNRERLSQGLPALKYSQALSEAANAKASDMFSNNYWAHTSPSGTTPWDFILNAGYDYTHAGENLAKDFSNTPNMISAWMNSPTHRDNIISPNYTEIGVAVVPGNLEGEDTVLVVQMFGTTGVVAGEITSEAPEAPPEEVPAEGSVSEVPEIAEIAPLEDKEQVVDEDPAPEPPVSTKLLLDAYNTFNVKKFASMTTAGLMILVLLLDLFIAESKKLKRRVGKNWAHLIFINIILISITFITAGHIL